MFIHDDPQVHKRVAKWKGTMKSGCTAAQEAQLKFIAEVVEYMMYLSNKVFPHGNSKEQTPRKLPSDIPILGPKFLPPSYAQQLRRNPSAQIVPETAYLKPVNVLSRFFLSNDPNFGHCPRCNSLGRTTKLTQWEWAPAGPRFDVHGLEQEETAIGEQGQCTVCEKEAKSR
jgi:hypothetical protein